jgi:hypothetical protein
VFIKNNYFCALKSEFMLRTVFTPQNDNFVFPIPTEYIGKELEILVFPTADILPKSWTPKKATFNAISIDTRQYKFNREEANAR